MIWNDKSNCQISRIDALSFHLCKTLGELLLVLISDSKRFFFNYGFVNHSRHPKTKRKFALKTLNLGKIKVTVPKVLIQYLIYFILFDILKNLILTSV
jgi:hypothetical protein